ncbi:hypothetical protein KGF57_005031 [Candida theae]|uniref:Uncharacterized protein n=1 Tax=Candida theae TaxID=1198502 RepID=A0AAD5BAY0_9ASCO|nr:uncharacterized protein KGF57_005031 [Candida theae]KAI5948968.1 hypothetical protein KGF57_005031 [Candida theae]
MSSASYREKCNDAVEVSNSEENRQEASNVPAQTINDDSLVNQQNIDSRPPPTSTDQMDRLQIQEMKKLASQSVGGSITRLGNGAEGSRDASLSHLNNDDDKRSGGGENTNTGNIRYVTSDDTDKNNENLRK